MKNAKPTTERRQRQRSIEATLDRWVERAYRDPLIPSQRTRLGTLMDMGRMDSRVSFAVVWFPLAKKAEAEEFGALVKKSGRTHNGGWFHDSPTGYVFQETATEIGIAY